MIIGSFPQEKEASEIEEVTYLGSSMVNFSTNMNILIDNAPVARMKDPYFYVCRIDGIDCDELDVAGLKNPSLAKSKFILVVNDQLVISKCQLKAILPDPIFEVDCRKDVFVFQVV
ncbi:hypothetical protein AVEN_40136-1 [Araneus ventricosus]|uniref:Uncharacterized protein n=1 Tax=Araneus ventricosus TaxID=182803 RepID=A0A4Y2ELD8_ARAVE|nr:hypothetical protein AVEN_40136-1 [Araneus ventricosus]